MEDSITIQQIIKQLEGLAPQLQKKVLDFTRELSGSQPRGTMGKDLLQFAGTISPDDIKAMKQAIEEGCEQVNASEW